MVNRVRTVRVELRPSGIHAGGVGVFAVCQIEKGQKVFDGLSMEDFQGLISWDLFESYDADVQLKITAFCVGTPSGFVPPEDFDFNNLSIDWYLNHSCDGNCGFDAKGGDFIAIRRVRKGEELTYDYGLVESNPRFSMKCSCGSKDCRHEITGNDWKNERFLVKNRDHMHPYLRASLP